MSQNEQKARELIEFLDAKLKEHGIPFKELSSLLEEDQVAAWLRGEQASLRTLSPASGVPSSAIDPPASGPSTPFDATQSIASSDAAATLDSVPGSGSEQLPIARSQEMTPGGFHLSLGSQLAGSDSDIHEKGTLDAAQTLDSIQETGQPAAPQQRKVTPTKSRFEFLRPLDRGGLGVLEVARDRELGREVALKKIRPDKANLPVYRSKFVREAEVTGNLEHPGIVPVYGLGIDERGQPYYAMRLIRGKTLAVKIREFLTLTSKDPRQFYTPHFQRLLEHFVTVCQTIAFAHDRGVLHRDLKPVNIMVGKYGETFVVDWGLAKLLSEKDVPESGLEAEGKNSFDELNTATRYGTALGTPAYAPPEQVLGKLEEIDTRSDVYGLGAMLFEMLTGETPVTGKNITEVLSRARSGEVRSVLEMQPNAPKPLAAICMKCLKFQPGDRYPSVQLLLEDIENWKADLPVTAMPENTVARVARWTRRHRGLTISTAVGLLAVTLISSIAAAVIFRQKEQVARLATEEKVARQSAEAVRDFLVDAFRSPDPLRDGRDIRVVELLEHAGAKIDTLEDPALQATMNLAVGQSLFGLGLPQDAANRLEKSVVGYQQSQGTDNEYWLRAQKAWGIALRRSGELKKSVKELSVAVDAAKTMYGPRAPETLELTLGLAASLLREGQVNEAIEHYRHVYETFRQQAGPQTAETLVALDGLANAELQAGQISDAETHFNMAYDGRVALLGPKHLETLNSLSGVAECQMRTGRSDIAVSQLREVLAGQTELLGESHPDRLATVADLAAALRKLGKNNEAIELLQQAFDLYVSKLGASHPETLGAARNLAEAYEATGQVPKSVPLLEATLEQMLLKFPENHRDVLAAQHNLAHAYQSTGQFAKARENYERVVAARIEQFGADHPDTLASQVGFCESLIALGELQQGRELLESTLDKQIKKLGDENPDVAATRARLAEAYRMLEDYPRAATLYALAVAQLSTVRGPEHPDTLAVRNGQALTLIAQGDLEKGIAALREVYDLLAKTQGADHPNTLQARIALAGALRQNQQLDEALPMLEETSSKIAEVLGRYHPTRLLALTNLALAYRDARLLDDAESLLADVWLRQKEETDGDDLAAADTAIYLASLRIERELPQAAIEPADWAVQRTRERLGGENPKTRLALKTLAIAQVQLRDYPAAEKTLNQWLESVRDSEVQPTELIDAKVALARVLIALTRQNEAIPLFEQVVTLAQQSVGETAAETLSFGLELARLQYQQKHYDVVVKLLEQRRKSVKDVPRKPVDKWEELTLLGMSYLESDQWEPAKPLLHEALAITESEMPGSWPWAWTAAAYGHVQMRGGEVDAGAKLLKLAITALSSQASLLPEDLRELPEKASGWLKWKPQPEK